MTGTAPGGAGEDRETMTRWWTGMAIVPCVLAASAAAGVTGAPHGVQVASRGAVEARPHVKAGPTARPKAVPARTRSAAAPEQPPWTEPMGLYVMAADTGPSW